MHMITPHNRRKYQVSPVVGFTYHIRKGQNLFPNDQMTYWAADSHWKVLYFYWMVDPSLLITGFMCRATVTLVTFLLRCAVLEILSGVTPRSDRTLAIPRASTPQLGATLVSHRLCTFILHTAEQQEDLDLATVCFLNQITDFYRPINVNQFSVEHKTWLCSLSHFNFEQFSPSVRQLYLK